jgi:hypothetical protein
VKNLKVEEEGDMVVVVVDFQRKMFSMHVNF